ncbi:hypothetical protein Ancab_022084 [Ancistrocladus abbreviatus]
MPIGELFLGAFLQVLFDRIASKPVLDFFQCVGLDKSHLKHLNNILLMLEPVLDNAEEKQFTNGRVKEWLHNLKAAVFDAEDLLDQIAMKNLPSSMEPEPESQSWGAAVRNFVSSPFNSFEKEAASRLNEIIQMLETMANQIPILGLTAGAPLSTASQTRLTTSLVKESQVYGRKEEKERIIQLLLSQETDRDSTVGGVAIVGMAGMGKTTLARSVYNDDRLEGHFDFKSWIYVSNDFDVVRATKSALESVTPQPSCNLQSLEKIQVELSERLRGRKFLLVLDDVWSERIEDWELLCCPFNTGAQGSRIIVTARNEGVADIMGAFPKVRLHKLLNEDGWSLFSRYAFQSGTSTGKDSQLVKIGQKIVEKCDGLPLAIKILGSLLRSKLERKHWEKVLSSSILDLPGGNNDILPPLSLSYCFLPSHLKRCFAYCAMFPKGYQFEKEKLVLLWMAAGFLDSPNNNIVLEDVGDECFGELLSRSFFDEATNLYGGQRYVIHDLTHDLAKFVSGDICAHFEKNKQLKIAETERARHIAYDRGNYDDFDRFEDLSKAKRVRSFLPLGSLHWQYHLIDRVSREILPELGALRVLSLAWYSNIIELPTAIGDLKQLRYLDVSFTNIIVLPESICTLCNLQTLLLSGCARLQKLPTTIGNLKQLRHLDVSSTFIKELPVSICTLCNLQTLSLRGCLGVQKLPDDTYKLSSLRCLAINESNVDEMPKQLSMLEKLHSLDMFVVGKAGGSPLAELRGLQQLRGKLGIKGLENVDNVDDAQEADLKEMGDLDDLTFKFRHSRTNNSEKQRDVLENLRPHANLKKLTVLHYGAPSFPSWLGDHSFQGMTSLHLSNCRFCDSLPPLGQLPSLKVLSVREMHNVRLVGAEFYGCGTPLRCLEEVVFESMEAWEEWIVEGASFPRLKKLQLSSCPKLRGYLPAHLPSLERLKIQCCQQLEGPLLQLESISKLDLGGCDKVELREIFQLTTVTRLALDSLPQLINMPPSGLTELPSLKSLKIWSCSNFISFEDPRLPDGLEQLGIRNCPALKSLPEDMFKHTRISAIYIWCCGSLEFCYSQNDGLPSSIQSLSVTEVKKMEFPKLISLERMQLYSSLSLLRIGNDVGLVSFPLGVLPKLQTLIFQRCENLENIYIPEGRGITAQNGLKSLSTLCISDCPKLEHVAREGLPAPNLITLSFMGCENLKSLPLGVCTNLTSLRELTVGRCPALEPISDMEFPHRLILLEIDNFEQLRSHWTENDKRSCFHRLQCLKELEIQGWSSVECFPEKDSLPTTLQLLKIQDFPNLKRLDAEGLLNLKSLEKLWISNCPQLKFTPDQDFPPNLNDLAVDHFEHLTSLRVDRRNFFHNFLFLTALSIAGYSSVECFPEKGSLPLTLRRLTIREFSNLKMLDGKGLQTLKSLQQLSIDHCPLLLAMPEEGLPRSLSYLEIYECDPVLKERCERDIGPDWPKISHIEYIYIYSKEGSQA